MELHPYVAQLVRAVARFMYRDEFIVVLDALSRHVFIREDKLEDLLCLTQKHSMRLLQELENDRMVCSEEVAEKGIRKRDREGGAEAQVRELEAELDGKAVAADSANETDMRKVKTKVWFINPRYFVDVVRYRIHIMREVLRKQESHSLERQSMYACSSGQCVYEASTADAMKHMMASTASNIQNGAEHRGGLLARRTTHSGAVATPRFGCPACGAEMRKKDGRAVMAAAANRLDSFNTQLGTSGISDCLKSLNSVALGANRPSDHLEEKLVTLRGGNNAGYKAIGSSTWSSNGHSGNVLAYGAGGGAAADAEVSVMLTGAEPATLAPGRTEGRGTSVERVDIASVPAFLQQSAFTGATAQSVGFLKADSSDGSAIRAASKTSATPANFFELLSQMELASKPERVQSSSTSNTPENSSGVLNSPARASNSASDDDGWT